MVGCFVYAEFLSRDRRLKPENDEYSNISVAGQDVHKYKVVFFVIDDGTDERRERQNETLKAVRRCVAEAGATYCRIYILVNTCNMLLKKGC